MTDAQSFDLLQSPLEGTNLIEASAGTGKTHTITGLFLRLVLEKDLPVNEILVVTFTEAATEELKHRIRTKLREAVSAFSSGQSDDDFMNGLLKRAKNTKIALRRLNAALRAFDQSAIFTIHGFCRRMLHENAFESGSLFDTELVTDQENLKREIVDDFWRMHFYEASLLFVRYCLENNVSPDTLFALLGNRVSQPYLKIIPEVELPKCSKQENEFKAAFKAVSKFWQSSRAEVEKILSTDQSLNRNRYRKANISIWIQRMDLHLNSRSYHLTYFKGFEKFTSSELKASVKKDRTPPVHPFFEWCERLHTAREALTKCFDQRLLWLKGELFHYTSNQLSLKKANKNVQSFDDLLNKLHNALEQKGGEYLAGAVRFKFKAALIDEFQDTDPVQYAIFKRVFDAEDRTLFLIGDPKQAVYGFRGADIFAYMSAKKDVRSRHTLRANWRSDPDLITAINAVFEQHERPFVYDEIPFNPAQPATERKPNALKIDGHSEFPFRIWFLDSSNLTDGGKPIPKSQAQDMICEAVASEISRLVHLGRSNRATLGPSPLKEEDIAVLVRTNAEARRMQETLSALRIPAVLYSTENLFDTHEAMEVERILTGISEPSRENLIRTALTTDVMGVSGEGIEALMKDEAGWENWLVEFKHYHDLWNEQGFIRMFRYLMTQQKVLPRLMTLNNGERRNTNMLHLAEVLHQKSVETNLGMPQLLKWLSAQKQQLKTRVEEHQLRLESDENAVKIVTIHKSKGLEYPIVFCPFVWASSRIYRSKVPVTFHEERSGHRLTLDLGSSDLERHRILAENELLAENVRLLYVGLTRSRNRCYLVWGRFNQAETAAPAYILHGPQLSKDDDIVNATGEKFRHLTDEDVLRDLAAAVDASGGCTRLTIISNGAETAPAPLSRAERTLIYRKFSGIIDRTWRISSFSALVSGRRHAEELPDRDVIGSSDEPDEKAAEISETNGKLSGLHAFPKGAKAGTFFHDILEHLDFTQFESTVMETLVAEKLRSYGFEPHWRDTICAMLRKVLSVPLDPKSGKMTLSCIPNDDRLNELEFYFPLKTMSPEKLKTVFQQTSKHPLSPDFPQTLERLQFAPTHGFMRGFMDLVFRWHGRYYLVDWKSNFLGNRIADYDPASLALEIEKEFYVLQYIIYTLALDQYLRLRVPGYRYEAHFGGAYYVFLRGVDPEIGSDYGIYRDRPAPSLIAALYRGLIDNRT
jgi:exodeoxyribonuclease V beta subunit